MEEAPRKRIAPNPVSAWRSCPEHDAPPAAAAAALGTGTRILIVEDHPLLRETVGRAIEAALPHSAILEAGSIAEASQSVQLGVRLHLVLLDLTLPDATGFNGLRAIRRHFPTVPVVVFTAADSAAMGAEAMAQGAAAYVPKSASKPVLLDAIAAVLKGGRYMPPKAESPARCTQKKSSAGADIEVRVRSLSQSQIRVLRLVRQGLLNKQIAYELGITQTTVKAHVSAILIKLTVGNRTQLVIATSKVDLEAIIRGKDVCAPAAGNGSDSARGRKKNGAPNDPTVCGAKLAADSPTASKPLVIEKNTDIAQPMRELALKSIDQARAAYTQLLDASRRAQDMMKSLTPAHPLTKELSEAQDKAMTFAEQNLEASFALAHEPVKARALTDAFLIQSKHSQAQMQAFALQAQELAGLVSEAAKNANPPSNSHVCGERLGTGLVGQDPCSGHTREILR